MHTELQAETGCHPQPGARGETGVDPEARSPHESRWTDADVDRYVLGKMSEQEQEAFELAYFDDAALFEQVKLTEMLVRGLAADERQSVTPGRRLRSLVTAPAWSITATAAAVLLGVAALLQIDRPQAGVDGATLAGVARMEGVALGSVRGAPPPEAAVTLPLAPGLVMLEVGLPPNLSSVKEGSRVRMRLRPSAGGESVAADGLVQDGFAMALIPALDLRVGLWEVIVEDEGGRDLVTQQLVVTPASPRGGAGTQSLPAGR